MWYFQSHPRFSHILGLFPPHIFPCSSCLSPKYFCLAFLQTYFFSHYNFIFFWDKPVTPLISPGDKLHFPWLPAPLPCVTMQVSAPNLAFPACSQEVSHSPALFLLSLCFLLGDFPWFSYYNNHALFY